MMLIPADQVVFGEIALLLLAAGLVAWGVCRRFAVHPRQLMSDREWRIAARLIGIMAMSLVLYHAAIAFGFPAEVFIYGRF